MSSFLFVTYINVFFIFSFQVRIKISSYIELNGKQYNGNLQEVGTCYDFISIKLII